MKVIITLSACILFFCASTLAQTPSCKDFKNGKFRIYDKGGNITIIRSGSKQTEIVDMTGQKLVMKVKWLNDCTYVLTPSKSKKQSLPGGDSSDVTVKIVEASEMSCKIEAVSSDSPMIHRFELIKVKD